MGRDGEVQTIARLLNDSRLVTLVGPGGAGKTRLASVAAAELADRYSDGVWLVELAPITDPADIARTVLGSLGLRESNILEGPQLVSGRDVLTRLTDAVTGKQLLMVLDNCEHLIAEAAAVVDHLLGRCPELRVVATSREPLAIFGEALCPVPSLGLPEPDADPATASRFAAVRLFAARASAA